MKMKTNLKAGGRRIGGTGTNYSQTLVRDNGAGLKVKTRLKSGIVYKTSFMKPNHNQTLVRDNAA